MGNQAGIIIRNVKNELFHYANRLILNEVKGIECLRLNLTSIIIPNSVTAIGSYAFEDCKSLSSITIGNSVNRIGNKAFNYCVSLKAITLPKSLATIGDDVFPNCDNLKSVTCLAEKAPVSDSPVNVSKIKNNITLFVPLISIDDYKGKEPWKSFVSIMSITE